MTDEHNSITYAAYISHENGSFFFDGIMLLALLANPGARYNNRLISENSTRFYNICSLYKSRKW